MGEAEVAEKQGTEITVVDPRTDLSLARAPENVLEEARKAAKALQTIIAGKKKPVVFNGEQYVEFEDWQTVAKFYGITAKVLSTEYVEFGEVKGFQARAVAYHIPTGQEISAADSMCLNDEKTWSAKPLFQLRSMAQTRACAKALRNILAWVIVLAGYKPTPAEEMDGVAGQQPAGTKSEGKFESPAQFVPASFKTKDVNKSTLYTVTTPTGKYLTTFDDKQGAILADAFEEKFAVEVAFHETVKEGKTYLNIDSVKKA